MKLIKARPSDAPELARIHSAARQAAMPWLPTLYMPAEVEAFFAHAVLPCQSVWIAREGAKTLGFAALDDGWLTHLYVAPEAWRKGVGSALLRRVQATVDVVQLHVFQQNAVARGFYRAHGFHEADARPATANEEGAPDLRMIWRRSDVGCA